MQVVLPRARGRREHDPERVEVDVARVVRVDGHDDVQPGKRRVVDHDRRLGVGAAEGLAEHGLDPVGDRGGVAVGGDVDQAGDVAAGRRCRSSTPTWGRSYSAITRNAVSYSSVVVSRSISSRGWSSMISSSCLAS